MSEDVITQAEKLRDEYLNDGKPKRDESFVSSVNFLPVLLSDISEEVEQVDWLWEGFLAKGHTTLFSALWKSGKSTLIAHLLKSMQSDKSLAGRTTRKTKVLILSEESKGIWKRRQEDYGIELETWIVSRPIKQRLGSKEWINLIEQIVEFCKKKNIELVVIDTVSGFWSVQDENNASMVNAALLPLNHFVENNISLLLIHHFRKSGGEEGSASRGSGALGALVDIIVEFTRQSGSDPNNNQRVIKTYSRFEESPREVVIDLIDGEYITLGTRNEVSKQSGITYLYSLLPESGEGLTTNELHTEWDADERKKPTKRTIQNYIGELQKQGKVTVLSEITIGKAKTPRYGKQTENVRKERELPIRDFVASKACYSCGSKKWWRRHDGGVVCSVCHPPSTDSQVAEWIEGK